MGLQSQPRLLRGPETCVSCSVNNCECQPNATYDTALVRDAVPGTERDTWAGSPPGPVGPEIDSAQRRVLRPLPSARATPRQELRWASLGLGGAVRAGRVV